MTPPRRLVIDGAQQWRLYRGEVGLEETSRRGHDSTPDRCRRQRFPGGAPESPGAEEAPASRRDMPCHLVTERRSCAGSRPQAPPPWSALDGARLGGRGSGAGAVTSRQVRLDGATVGRRDGTMGRRNTGGFAVGQRWTAATLPAPPTINIQTGNLSYLVYLAKPADAHQRTGGLFVCLLVFRARRQP